MNTEGGNSKQNIIQSHNFDLGNEKNNLCMTKQTLQTPHKKDTYLRLGQIWN